MIIESWMDGRLIERPNRFLAIVNLEGRAVEAHVPDPGRLTELLYAGARVRVKEAKGKRRRTKWEVIGAFSENGPVNIDSRLPNKLFKEALTEGNLAEFSDVKSIRTECRIGNAVLDFLIETNNGICVVEVKGCTLVRDGVALFPDAPTLRGSRHLRELMSIASEGKRACIVFIIKAPGSRVMMPNRFTDPQFAAMLSEAAGSGVEAIAYEALWNDRSIRIGRRVDVVLR